MRLRPSNGIWKSYKDKRIMILVPHQDDELFLCGTILGGLRQVTRNIFIVFTTNGDYGNNFYTRRKECIRALSVYGVGKDNIFFLGYGDQYSTEYGHMYHAPEDEIIISRAGYDNTYGDDFCMKSNNFHHTYTLSNFKKDLENIIRLLLPDVFFCNDLDWHPEHRFTSLMFDKVMGELLEKDRNYRPAIYKGFIYFLGWDGKLDYKEINLDNTKKPHRYLIGDKRFELGNPYFLWSERISFPIDSSLVAQKRNSLYHAIQKYAFSKNAKRFYYSMMNSDAVFWKRETDNLLYDATIRVSSGKKEYLNDFVIADSSNIIHKNMPFDKGVWYPNIEDITPKIEIVLKKVSKAHALVFYRDVNSYARIECKLCIIVKGLKNGEMYNYNIEHNIKKYEIKSMVKLDDAIDIVGINITMESNSIGFSEMELLRNTEPFFLKIQINGNYIYNYYIDKEDRELLVGIRNYGIEPENVIREVIQASPSKASVKWEKDRLYFEKDFKSCFIKISSKINSNIFDVVKILKSRK